MRRVLLNDVDVRPYIVRAFHEITGHVQRVQSLFERRTVAAQEARNAAGKAQPPRRAYKIKALAAARTPPIKHLGAPAQPQPLHPDKQIKNRIQPHAEYHKYSITQKAGGKQGEYLGQCSMQQRSMLNGWSLRSDFYARQRNGGHIKSFDRHCALCAEH
jgi:hypothetical protein